MEAGFVNRVEQFEKALATAEAARRDAAPFTSNPIADARLIVAYLFAGEI